jgi:hypothetical protein
MRLAQDQRCNRAVVGAAVVHGCCGCGTISSIVQLDRYVLAKRDWCDIVFDRHVCGTCARVAIDIRDGQDDGIAIDIRAVECRGSAPTIAIPQASFEPLLTAKRSCVVHDILAVARVVSCTVTGSGKAFGRTGATVVLIVDSGW